MPEKEIAACGLLCNECSILKASFDEEEAKKVRRWLIDINRLEECIDVEDFMKKGPHCEGCHGDINNHWASDCWILECCVHDKDLDDCSQCDYFACDRLIEWSKESEDYKEAFERLREKNSKRAIETNLG